MRGDAETVVRRVATAFVRRSPRLKRDLDDLAQEGLIAAWRQEATKPGHVGAVARSAMIDWLRATYVRTRAVRDEHGNVIEWIPVPRRSVGLWDSLEDVAAVSDGEVLTKGDLLTAPDDPADQAATRVDGVNLLRALPVRDRAMVWARGEGHTLASIAAVHGDVTESRVCQIVRRAMRRTP